MVDKAGFFFSGGGGYLYAGLNSFLGQCKLITVNYKAIMREDLSEEGEDWTRLAEWGN